MAMQTSSTAAPSHWQSRSEYLSTLPLWRRLLGMLNWRPVYEIEKETERLRNGNARLDAIWRLSDSNLPTPPEADSN